MYPIRKISNIQNCLAATGYKPITVPIIGPTGATGATGDTGATGNTGPTGDSYWTYDGTTLFNNVPAQNIIISAGATGYTGTISLNPEGGTVTIGSGSTASSLTVYGNVTATKYTSTSDYRIKTSVEPINLHRQNVDSLNPVFYYNTRILKNEFGFLAHEVQEIFPFLVTGEKDDTNELQSLNYTSFIALMIKEIQGLKLEIKELKTIVNEWKSTQN